MKTERALSADRRCNLSAVNVANSRLKQIADDRANLAARRCDPADRRRRSALCARALRLAHEKDSRCSSPRAAAEALALGARVSSHRGFARRLFARHARLDRIESSEAGSDDAAHSSADAHDGRRSAAGLSRGAFSFVTKPTTPEGLGQRSARSRSIRTPATQTATGG